MQPPRRPERTRDRHRDRTGDAGSSRSIRRASTDLDQAFAIEPSGRDLLLHYAIADVGWFVDDGRRDRRRGVEARRRRSTCRTARPALSAVLSEGAASLLPDGPRPAVVFTDPRRAGRRGHARRRRARDRSAAAPSSPTRRARRRAAGRLRRAGRGGCSAAEARRGAARVDPPEQEVDALPDGALRAAPSGRALASEERNAALSLAANLAVAELLLDASHRPVPGDGRARRARPSRDLRHTRARARPGLAARLAAGPVRAAARLRPSREQAAFMLAIRRAGPGASYAPFAAGTRRRGTRRWRRPMPTPPRRSAASPTAMWSRPRWRSPVGRAGARRSRRDLPRAALRSWPRRPASPGALERATLDA